jgi:hypothetical protein
LRDSKEDKRIRGSDNPSFDEKMEGCNLSEANSVLDIEKGGFGHGRKDKSSNMPGAATAANCIPCFEHYFGKAKAVGLTSEEFGETVDLASQVKKGAHLAIRNRISDRMGGEKMFDLPCDRQTNQSCCGSF